MNGCMRFSSNTFIHNHTGSYRHSFLRKCRVVAISCEERLYKSFSKSHKSHWPHEFHSWAWVPIKSEWVNVRQEAYSQSWRTILGFVTHSTKTSSSWLFDIEHGCGFGPTIRIGNEWRTAGRMGVSRSIMRHRDGSIFKQHSSKRTATWATVVHAWWNIRESDSVDIRSTTYILC
jgi:hypothetical protein